jgi:hypothetical protein
MMKVPTFKEAGLTDFLNKLMIELDRAENDNLSSVTANNSLLLLSPSKKVFEVKVSDTGVLTATKVQG